MTALRTILVVAAGSAVGGALRAGASAWLHQATWPMATVAVNLVGSFVLGLVMGSPSLTNETRALLGAGLCGGLTTFSTLAFEAVRMLGTGQWLHAVLYIAATVVLGLGACWFGLTLAQ